MEIGSLMETSWKTNFFQKIQPLENSQKKSRVGKSEVDLHVHQEEMIDDQPSSQVLTQEAILENESAKEV